MGWKCVKTLDIQWSDVWQHLFESEDAILKTQFSCKPEVDYNSCSKVDNFNCKTLKLVIK